MMPNPYNEALKIPSAFDLDCLVKKLTVNGIIGKIHGMISAAKPPKKPSQNVDPNPFQMDGTGALVTRTEKSS